MKLEGLTDFQNDLLNTAKNTDTIMKDATRAWGNKAKNHVKKKAKAEVQDDTGNYNKSWKRGKVFKGREEAWVTRVINSSPHAHLIEDGHRQVVNGKEVGFVKGKKVLSKGIDEFDAKTDTDDIFSKAIDRLLAKNKL